MTWAGLGERGGVMRSVLWTLGVAVAALCAVSSAASSSAVLPPKITSFTPGSGPPGAIVTINGSNLLTTVSGTIGTLDLQDVTPLSSTRVRATVPEEAV